MAHKVDTMAYVGETPWHGLGFEILNKSVTPKQMQQDAQCDWAVELCELQAQAADGTIVKVENKLALMRRPGRIESPYDNKILDVVGKVYKPIQNDEVFAFFEKYCTSAGFKMETAGSLWHGRFVWALARMDGELKIGRKSDPDVVRRYVLLMQPHAYGKSLIIQYTPVRVVCWNTLNFALGRGLRGDDGAFRMPHSRSFDDAAKLAAAQTLNLIPDQVDEFETIAQSLVEAKIKPKQAEEFFAEVMKADPRWMKDQERRAKEGKPLREFQAIADMQQAMLEAPGADLRTSKDTLWGALNAVTFVVDHVMGTARDTALHSAWVGNTKKVKQRAFDLACEWASIKRSDD